MAVKKKKEGVEVFLIHYRQPDGAYNFALSTGENIEKKKLELMLLGMEDINIPLLEWGKGGAKTISSRKIKWEDYSLEDIEKMKHKRKKRV